MSTVKLRPSAASQVTGSVPVTPWPQAQRKTLAGAAKLILLEPIAHFIIAGAALAWVGHVYQTQHSLNRIVVTPAHVAQLANQYALQFGSKPDPHTLRRLIDRDIHEEILFRQGERLRLDAGDEIVRRRVVQKMQFLAQDLNAPTEPSKTVLRAFYQSNLDQYRKPARTTFSHIFFSTDRGGEAAARARAIEVLAGLSNTLTRAPNRGDPFPDLYDFSAYEPGQTERLFGHNAFTTTVNEAPTGRWTGPLRSGYGWHLLYVDARQPASVPAFEAVEDTVRTNYLAHAQEAANVAAYDKIAKDFRVVRADLTSGR